MNTKRDNYTYLTTGPVGRVILTMSVPAIVSMLVTSLYNIVDTFYVGRISTQATAALGIVFPVMTIMQACGFFFGQGAGTFISRALGAKEEDKASVMASTGFFYSVLFGLLISISGLLFLRPLSIALGSTPTILPYTEDFLRIILLGAPFVTGSMTLNNEIRYQGNAFYGMFGILSGAVLNVVTVPIFAFGLDMGIAGAAIGTVIGQVVGFFVLLAMTRHGGNLRIAFKRFSFKWTPIREIMKGGTPSLTRQTLACITTLMLNVAAGRYGDAAIAGMSIVTRVSFVVFSIIIGLGQGFQPLCGFNYGARLFDRVRAGYWFCIRAGLIFVIPISVLCFVFSEQIIDLLRHDPDVVAVGSVAFRWQILTYPLAVVITISNMMFQTSGRAVSANFLAACRNGICFIPMILLLPVFWGLGGVEVSQAAADVLTFIFAVPLTVRYFRTLKLTQDKSSILHYIYQIFE